MKIVFVAPRFHTNQVDWVCTLQTAEHDVYMHVLLQGATENYKDIHPLLFQPCSISKAIMRIFGAGGANLRRGFPSPLEYYLHLRKLRADILVVRDIGRWFSLLAAFCGRLMGVRIVIYSQTPLYKYYSLSRRFMTWIILSIFQAAWMTPIKGDVNISRQAPCNMFFVPFSVATFDQKVRCVNTPVRILSIGKFEARKNHLLLLKALKALSNEGFDFQLMILGEVSKPRHEKKINRVRRFIELQGLESRVKILTNIPHYAVASHYTNADFLVLPATAEPASISVLEAMSHGLPVVCSNTCGTRWYVNDGDTGILFQDGSLASLTESIKCLLDVVKLQEMRIKTLEKAKVEMSSSVFYSSFTNMLEIRFPGLRLDD